MGAINTNWCIMQFNSDHDQVIVQNLMLKVTYCSEQKPQRHGQIFLTFHLKAIKGL